MKNNNSIQNNSINKNILELKNVSLKIEWQEILNNINLKFDNIFLSFFWKSWSWKSMLLNLILG